MTEQETITSPAGETDASLVVSEVFGPTVQGEGPHLGELSAFVRLGGCNLHCSWCDTAYTWDADRFDLRAELHRVSVSEIMDQIRQINPRRVILTGGEPLLHQTQPGWTRLIRALFADGFLIEVETNGTIMPTPTTLRLVDHFDVSPKLEQGDRLEDRIKDDVLARFRILAKQGRANLKIVCTSVADVAAARRLADTYGFDLRHVYVMPEGVTPETITATTAKIADAVVDHRMNLTTRLQVYAWGTERGH